MMRMHEQQQHHHRRTQDAEAEGAGEHGVDVADLKHDLDGILDEIDSVLEENAEEFVNSYVQKGGQ